MVRTRLNPVQIVVVVAAVLLGIVGWGLWLDGRPQPEDAAWCIDRWNRTLPVGGEEVAAVVVGLSADSTTGQERCSVVLQYDDGSRHVATTTSGALGTWEIDVGDVVADVAFGALIQEDGVRCFPAYD